MYYALNYVPVKDDAFGIGGLNFLRLVNPYDY
jgi:hypothetical protein